MCGLFSFLGWEHQSAPLCHLLFARKLLQFVVFSPQVDRARAPLFSLSLGSFCNLWFLSSGWESKSFFAISLFARKLLQFLVFSPQVERARASLPSPCLLGSFCNFWFFLLRLREQELLCHLMSLFARKLLQFLVFSPQVERAPAPVPSPFARKLLLLGHYHLLC